jgi:LytS/YehU family sensor histidine kinase
VAIVAVVTAAERGRASAAGELRAATLEARLNAANLKALRTQLQPHFLFNALNSVAGLVRQGDRATATHVLSGFADLLRQVIDATSENEQPMSREIALVLRYVELEQTRWGQRLTLDVDISDAAKHALAPRLFLQPLVENAIRHGAREGRPLHVHLRAVVDRETLIVTVQDDGAGISPSNGARGAGVGIENIRVSLSCLYGEEA